MFGRTAEDPFRPESLQRRADDAWRDAGLERITFHECRHTFASLMIAAGVNAKALSTYMGHANISITLDRYGHLMPGSEDEAAKLLDAYLAAERERAEQAPRAAQIDVTGAQTGAQTGASENGLDKPQTGCPCLDVVHPRAGLLGLAAGDVGDRGAAEDVAERLDALLPDAAGLLALLAPPCRRATARPRAR